MVLDNLQCKPEEFINDLVKVAKAYGWSGDYVEVARFVEDTIEEFGYNSKDFDLQPDND